MFHAVVRGGMPRTTWSPIEFNVPAEVGTLVAVPGTVPALIALEPLAQRRPTLQRRTTSMIMPCSDDCGANHVSQDTGCGATCVEIR